MPGVADIRSETNDGRNDNAMTNGLSGFPVFPRVDPQFEQEHRSRQAEIPIFPNLNPKDPLDLGDSMNSVESENTPPIQHPRRGENGTRFTVSPTPIEPPSPPVGDHSLPAGNVPSEPYYIGLDKLSKRNRVCDDCVRKSRSFSDFSTMFMLRYILTNLFKFLCLPVVFENFTYLMVKCYQSVIGIYVLFMYLYPLHVQYLEGKETLIEYIIANFMVFVIFGLGIGDIYLIPTKLQKAIYSSILMGSIFVIQLYPTGLVKEGNRKPYPWIAMHYFIASSADVLWVSMFWPKKEDDSSLAKSKSSNPNMTPTLAQEQSSQLIQPVNLDDSNKDAIELESESSYDCEGCSDDSEAARKRFEDGLLDLYDEKYYKKCRELELAKTEEECYLPRSGKLSVSITDFNLENPIPLPKKAPIDDPYLSDLDAHLE